MTPFEFYCLSAAEYILKARGHRNKTLRRWEHTRHISYTIAQVNSSDVLPPPEVWMPLPTDSEINSLLDQGHMEDAWSKATQRHGAGIKGKD